ncbi:hypothetical protein BDR26DRAFT_854336 [Obelidium mucronatum]|nr:hypothetical protein BDR26DRAFT_854336 [Obelidium mucronatum]
MQDCMKVSFLVDEDDSTTPTRTASPSKATSTASAETAAAATAPGMIETTMKHRREYTTLSNPVPFHELATCNSNLNFHQSAKPPSLHQQPKPPGPFIYTGLFINPEDRIRHRHLHQQRWNTMTQTHDNDDYNFLPPNSSGSYSFSSTSSANSSSSSVSSSYRNNGFHRSRILQPLFNPHLQGPFKCTLRNCNREFRRYHDLQRHLKFCSRRCR